MRYRRLTQWDRCQIAAFLQVGLQVADIARRVGYHRSTIYREFQRNRVDTSYQPVLAQKLARRRRQHCRRSYRIVDGIENAVLVGLTDKLSPQQIAGRLRYLGFPIVHQTIYNYVVRHGLQYHLPRFGRRGGGRVLQRRARYRYATMIDQRPSVVDRRSRLGDWERDGMYVGGEQLLVLTERKSRYLAIEQMATSSPQAITQLTEAMLAKHPVHTVTNDNGPEFRDSHHLRYPAYHCQPRKPQQRGTVENTIGRLRRYLPRQAKASVLNRNYLKQLVDRYNHTPRKCLNYKTPHEILRQSQSVALAIRT